MDNHKHCNGCPNEHECKDVYHKLGNSQAPSVTIKVIIAFLIPMVVFGVTAALSEHFLHNNINSARLRTLVSFIIALTVTAIVLLGIKFITAKTDSTQNYPDPKNDNSDKS